LKIYVYYIGKPRDPHANALAEDYLARLSRFCPVEMRQLRPDRDEPWTRHASARKIFLDPGGRQTDSPGFASLVARAQQEGRDLMFVVGGADGLPRGWTAHADLLLSLSAMTWPHELARAMLTEQLYRAFATLRGHPYPR